MFRTRRLIQPGDVFNKDETEQKYVALSEPFHDLDMSPDGKPHDKFMAVWAARVKDDCGDKSYFDGDNPPQPEKVFVQHGGGIQGPELLAKNRFIRNATLFVVLYFLLKWLAGFV